MGHLIRFTATTDFDKGKRRLDELIDQVSDLTGFNEEVGAYLVSSTRNRIYSTKTAPDGTRWAPNSELTQALKGGSSVLYQTGELVSDIRVADADQGGVKVEAGAPYASYVQDGAKRMKGKYRSKDKPEPQIPAREFMGISDANKRRIARMLKDHIEGHRRDSDW